MNQELKPTPIVQVNISGDTKTVIVYLGGVTITFTKQRNFDKPNPLGLFWNDCSVSVEQRWSIANGQHVEEHELHDLGRLLAEIFEGR